MFVIRCFIALVFLHGLEPTVLPAGYPCDIFESSSPSNETFCQPKPDCSGFESQRYRTIDGRCNNLVMDPTWGSAKSPFARFVRRNPLEAFNYPPEFRIKKSGRTLPQARSVSTAIHGGTDEKFKEFTIMLMQFGQFLDHDLTLTAEMNMCHEEEESGCVEEELDCCEYVGKNEVPKGCYPIDIPEDDPFYRAHFPRPTCLDFKRSLPYPCNYSVNTHSGRIEQFNTLTAFVDASHVYDVDESKTLELRTLNDGLLKVSEGDLMPFEKTRTCNSTESPHKFFFSGDIRANENPGLQTHHTMWVREHNRLARHIKAKSPGLDDEAIFQEAKRFVAAEWQNIVYCEFLPVLLGPELMKKFNLDLSLEKDTLYKSHVDPSIFNSFATAAFRFGHSLISSKIPLMNSANVFDKSENLADNFFNTSLMLDGKMDILMRGMCFQDAEKPNNILTDAIRNFLFKRPGASFGSDLASRNIQRGRDHELGSYNYFRQACGLRSLPGSFFSQPPPEVKAEMWIKFSKVYKNPADIELFPGAMSEKLVEGGILGPTFACIIGQQFRNLKFGDRYFFTHVNVDRNIRFCRDDLGQIRNRTLRDVMCENTDLTEITPDPFKNPNAEGNEVQPCTKFNPLVPQDQPCLSEENDYDRFVPTSEFSNAAMAGEGEVAVLAGGYDGHRVLDSVEVYSPNGTCQHNLEPLPEKTYGLILTYCGGVILACGGRTPNGLGGKRCWKYERDNGKGNWVEENSMAMSQSRWLSAGTGVGGRYYVAGGWSSPNTTEYFDPDKKAWQPFVPMAHSRKRHCIVGYRDSLILIGGTDTGSMVEQFNLTTNTWSSLPPLTTFRNRHSCILLSEDPGLILAFGGTRVASIYHIDQGRSYFLSSAEVSRGFAGALDLNGQTFLLGGDSHTTRVEGFDHQKMSFFGVDVGLKEPRSRFGLTAVPARLFQHLPGGCRP